jgi:3-methyladenine DNA glycosylase AlkD
MKTLEKIKDDLNKFSSKDKALVLARFFKTGKGQYAEGDKFIGVVVPDQRAVAKKYFKEASLKDIYSLLQSGIHEHRLTALMLLIQKYNMTAEENAKGEIVRAYIEKIEYINNWDLVDLSAEKIIGDFLYNFKKDRTVLYEFAGSGNLWIQRIAILSTYYFIKKNDFNDTLKLAEIFLTHEHDLIHKAAGWMLRETGKRNFQAEFKFLSKYYKKMPRTMLRYAIEKFEPGLKEKFLKGRI